MQITINLPVEKAVAPIKAIQTQAKKLRRTVLLAKLSAQYNRGDLVGAFSTYHRLKTI